jgi:hypothetical protein
MDFPRPLGVGARPAGALEANLNVVTVTRQMLGQTINILRG